MTRCHCYPDPADARQGSRCPGCPKRAAAAGFAALLALLFCCGCAITVVQTPGGSLVHATILRRADAAAGTARADHKAMSGELGSTAGMVGGLAGAAIGGPPGAAAGVATGEALNVFSCRYRGCAPKEATE